MRTSKYTAVLRRSVLLALAALLFSVLSLPAQAAPATAPSDHGLTSASTAGSGVACSPVSGTITAPSTQQGGGTFCWQIASIPNSINSCSLTELTVNGVNYTNMWVPTSNLPAKINGFWYIKYTSSTPFGFLWLQ
jgi:tetrahydromethanopterin S-methyltransferase subunit D